MRRAALARAQQHDWPRVMAQLSERYTALLGRPPLPVPGASQTHPGLAATGRVPQPQLAQHP
jgi:alpha-1,6-mannosyltransferase